MSGPARRDLVWDAALRALVMSPAAIRLQDVQELVAEDVSDRTVRRAMNAMLALGWLEKEKDTGHYWMPGPKARQFLRVPTSERALQPPEEVDVDAGAVLADVKIDVAPDLELQELVDELDIPGGGGLEERRRENLLQVLAYLKEEGEASPAELREQFYREAGLGYSSPRSWWKNLIYKQFRELEIVETGGKRSHKWFYVGPE